MFVQPVVASFSQLFQNNQLRVHHEFDGEDAEDDVEFEVGEDVQLVPIIFQAVTALGVMYKFMDILNRIWT
jgi:hypothetical protein